MNLSDAYCIFASSFDWLLTLTICFCFDSVLVVNVARASQMVLNTSWTWRLQTLWSNYVVRLTWSWSSERYPYRVPCGLRTFLVLSLLVVTTEEMTCSRRPWERTIFFFLDSVCKKFIFFPLQASVLYSAEITLSELSWSWLCSLTWVHSSVSSPPC